MSIKQVSGNLHVGNIADFGDVSALEAAGIEVAVVCLGTKAFPHTLSIATIAYCIHPGGEQNADVDAAMIELVAGLARTKNVLVCDEMGGLAQAAYMIVAADAESGNRSYGAARERLGRAISGKPEPDPEDDDPDLDDGLRIPEALEARGRVRWTE